MGKKFGLDPDEKIALIKITLATFGDYADDSSRIERIREIMKQ